MSAKIGPMIWLRNISNDHLYHVKARRAHLKGPKGPVLGLEGSEWGPKGPAAHKGGGGSDKQGRGLSYMSGVGARHFICVYLTSSIG